MRNIVGRRQRTLSQWLSQPRTRNERPAFRPVPEWLESRVVLSLTIVPNWDPSILADPNHDQIRNTIYTAINIFDSYISNNLTVPVTFAEYVPPPGSTATPSWAGKSSTNSVEVDYASYLASLNTQTPSQADKTALSVLNQTGNVNPLPNNPPGIRLAPALATSLGLIPTLASSGSGAIVHFTVTPSGAIFAVTPTIVGPNEGGSGYPPGKCDLFVYSNTNPGINVGMGGIVQADVNSQGVVTSYNPIPLAGGSGYAVPSGKDVATGAGYSAGATITLNMAELNVMRPDASLSKVDLLTTVLHELTEILGAGGKGSALSIDKNPPFQVNNLAPGPSAYSGPLDLFRFFAPKGPSEPGNRSYTYYEYGDATASFFSINGGDSDLGQFSQLANSDFGDWSIFGGFGPQVQDAALRPGLMMNLDQAELTALDVIGWTINADLPELSLTMGDSVGGATTSGQSWTWTLTVKNEGSEPAVFTNREAIVLDNLPYSGLTYNGVTVPADMQPGVTGKIDVPANVPTNGNLIATANGLVVIVPGGSFQILIKATAAAPATFANPRPFLNLVSVGPANLGVAMVDPYGLFAETPSKDNTASDTVKVLPGVGITVAPDITDANKSSVAVSGTGDNGDTVALTITDSNGGKVTAATVTVMGGKWSVSFNGSGLKDGSITYTATETAASGPPLTAARGASKLTAASAGGGPPPTFYWKLESTSPVVDPNNLRAGYPYHSTVPIDGVPGATETYVGTLTIDQGGLDYSYSDTQSPSEPPDNGLLQSVNVSMTFNFVPPPMILPGQTITITTTTTGTETSHYQGDGFVGDVGANPGMDVNREASGVGVNSPTPTSSVPDPFLPAGVPGQQSVALTRSWTVPSTVTSTFQGVFGPVTANNAKIEIFINGDFNDTTSGTFVAYYYDLVKATPPLMVGLGSGGTSSGAVVPNITNTNVKSVSVTGTGDPDKLISVSIQDGDGHTVTGPAANVGADGTWTVGGIDATSLTDGPVTYTVTETDGSGRTVSNMHTATKSLLAVTSPTEIADSTNGAAGVSVAGTGIKAGEAISVTISDGTNKTTPATTTVGTDGNWSVTGIDAGSLSDGPITYTVTETDANNVVTTATRTGTKILGPVVTITSAPNVTPANVHNLTVTGTGESGDTITVTVTDGLGDGLDPSSTVTTTVSGSTWSVRGIDASSLAGGQIAYIAAETDAAGNESSALKTASKMFVAFTSAPNITSANKGGVTVTGTGDSGDTIVLIVTDGKHKVTSSATVGADGAWSAGSINASSLSYGPITYTVTETAPDGSIASAVQSAIKLSHVIGDYLGIGKTTPAVFRRVSAGVAQWFVQGSSVINGRSFGAGGLDVPLAVDFGGDGKTDLAVYRPSTSQWFVQESGSNYVGKLLTTFGGPNDIPVPANYNGTGQAVVAVYRPTTGQWLVQGQPTLTFTTFKTGDIPVPGNYDNTGKDEPAIYRPSTGQWIIDGPKGVHTISFGGATDIPVPGAYDALTTGNASVEPAVWRPSTGQFFIDSPKGTRILQFAKGDVPAPGDYDGIGETEAAVYRPSTGKWLVMGPNDKAPRVVATYGGNGDTPTVAPYIYRALKSGGGLISKFSVGSPVAVDPGATARLLATSTVASSPSQTFSNSHTPANRLQPALKVLAVNTILQRATEQIDNQRTRRDINGTKWL